MSQGYIRKSSPGLGQGGKVPGSGVKIPAVVQLRMKLQSHWLNKALMEKEIKTFVSLSLPKALSQEADIGLGLLKSLIYLN